MNQNKPIAINQSEREQWEYKIKSKYPACEIQTAGSIVYASIADVDVGLFYNDSDYGVVFNYDLHS